MTTSLQEAPLVARCGYLQALVWSPRRGPETKSGVGAEAIRRSSVSWLRVLLFLLLRNRTLLKNLGSKPWASLM